eukprot:CAMPEP_0114697200 /NCGR_PEP_ID=MMETSP0191-20121206/73496_1 /TAXON_ID=126664 /ORGANISM="Sorites sp." /LENGTH=294 /DNA_ID=CAMNT_0001995957 /DNA_START=2200 /DNA_END=3081 /DNA_ORIENTATION=-
MALYSKDNITPEGPDDDISNNTDNKDDIKDANEYNDNDARNDSKKIHIKSQIRCADGRRLDSNVVIIEALKYMKNLIMDRLKAKIKTVKSIQDVQWILTVPAIWSLNSRAIMQRCAIQAGMIDRTIGNHLIIALEPECASLALQFERDQLIKKQKDELDQLGKQYTTNDDNLPIDNNSIDDIENKYDNRDEMKDNNIKWNDLDFESYFKRGDKYILVDLGGGTADIACHEIIGKYIVRSIRMASGGPWGSGYIDEAFIDLLRDIFGSDIIDELERDPVAYNDLMDNFRKSKQSW